MYFINKSAAESIHPFGGPRRRDPFDVTSHNGAPASEETFRQNIAYAVVMIFTAFGPSVPLRHFATATAAAAAAAEGTCY